jgi:hypothetical protein
MRAFLLNLRYLAPQDKNQRKKISCLAKNLLRCKLFGCLVPLRSSSCWKKNLQPELPVWIY